MKSFISLVFFFATAIPGYAQLLSWTPAFSKDNDNIIITMDAAKGNQGLLNYTPTTDVYVHVGLITSASANPGDWKYSKFTWASTNPAAQCTYLGSNKWQYTINNPRTFFNSPAGVPAGEVIKFIVILFRSGNGNFVQRNIDGSDMYIPVYDNNIAVRITEPLMQPTYKPTAEPIIKTVGDNITLTGIANQNCDLTLAMSPGFNLQVPNATTITGNAPIVTAGWNMIILRGHLNPDLANDTAIFFAAPAINVQALPPGVRDGINYETGGTSVVLVLYAPGKTRVTVVGEFPGTQWIEQPDRVMNKTPDGNYWWIRLTGLTPGTEYAFQYIVDGSLKIAEPYAEKILDPANDAGINSTTYPGLRSYPTGTSGIVSLLQTNAPG